MKTVMYPDMTEFEKLIGVKSVAITEGDFGNTKDKELETRSDGFVCESCNAVVKGRQNQQTCGSDNEAGRKRQYNRKPRPKKNFRNPFFPFLTRLEEAPIFVRGSFPLGCSIGRRPVILLPNYRNAPWPSML